MESDNGSASPAFSDISNSSASEIDLLNNSIEASTSALKNSPIQIELVDSKFVDLEADLLLNVARIVAEPIGMHPSYRADTYHAGPPYILMPEQVAVLIEYGLANIVRLKDGVIAIASEDSPKLEFDWQLLTERAKLIMQKRREQAEKKGKESNEANYFEPEEKIPRLDAPEDDSTEIRTIVDELVNKSIEKQKELVVISFYDERPGSYEKVDLPPPLNDIICRIRFITMRDLWKRGLYVTSGLKFGCEYLVYRGKPSEVHSKWMVKCVDSTCSIDPLSIITLSRLSSQVKKIVLLAIVSLDSLAPYYIEYKWWKGNDVHHSQSSL